MDRNISREISLMRPYVALRKESVDRNSSAVIGSPQAIVALRKESVDRNRGFHPVHIHLAGSLSARRAWIEIGIARRFFIFAGSLSARRAWIEIGLMRHCGKRTCRRSPQGERG